MATFYYENEYTDDGDDDKRKKNINKAKESTSKADDILSMIRARNNPNIDYDASPKKDSTKLRELLDKIAKEDPEVPDYSDTPIYKMGNDDGYDCGYRDGRKDGYNEANAHYKPIIKAIQTLIRDET